MLEYATLRAPFDGVVVERHVHTGHLVDPAHRNAKPLLVVTRVKPVRVLIDVPEADAAMVDVGDDVAIKVQSLGGQSIATKVARVSWALHETSRTLRAEVDVPNEQGILRPGMYAYTTITLAQQPQTLTLPISALKTVGTDSFCFVARKGKVHLTKVELGLRAGKECSITSGLTPESQVVVSGIDMLIDGQAVEAIPTERKP